KARPVSLPPCRRCAIAEPIRLHPCACSCGELVPSDLTWVAGHQLRRAARDERGHPIAGPRPSCRVCGNTDWAVPPVRLRRRVSYRATDNTYVCDDCAEHARRSARPRCRGDGCDEVSGQPPSQVRNYPSYDQPTNTYLCTRCTQRGPV